MKCPNCGTENPPGATVCIQCGRSLAPGAPRTRPQLLWIGDDQQPHAVNLSRGLTIGRTTGNDIVVPDSAVSRQHARIEVSAQSITIVDLGSLNGLKVNGEPLIGSRELANDDRITIGHTEFTVRIPTDSSGRISLDPDESTPSDELAATVAFRPDFEAAATVQLPAGLALSDDQHTMLAPVLPQGVDEEPATAAEDDRTIIAPLNLPADAQGTGLESPVTQTRPAAREAAPPEPAGYLLIEDDRLPILATLTIGRAATNDHAVPNDRMMSREHARLDVRNGQVWLTDARSANGTFVNGERIQEPVQLTNGAEIRFGLTEARFEAAPESVAAVPEVEKPDWENDATIVQPSTFAPPSGTGNGRGLPGTVVDDSDEHTLEGVAAALYIRQADMAEFQALRSGDTEPEPRVAAAADQYRLIINFGPQAGRQFLLDQETTIVGRRAEGVEYDVQLDDRAVSRPHARIVRQPSGFTIEDLESANGTWINYAEEIHRPRPLADGDIIKIGTTTLVYRVPAGIRPAAADAPLDPQIGQIITCFSLKGGVGTTTLAVNLAVLIRQLTSQPVLLVDLSTERGAVSVHLNLTPRLTLADLPTDPASIDFDAVATLITNHNTGVDVLAAPPSPQSAELVTAGAVAAALPLLRNHYKWIIVDTSGTFSELNLCVFDQADLFVLLCAPDLTSLKVMQATLDVFDALQISGERRVLALNQIQPTSFLQRDDLERALGERIAISLPYGGPAVLDAADHGIPLAVHDPTNPSAGGIRSFAEQLTHAKATAQAQPRRGGFGRFVQGVLSSLRR